MPINLYAPLPLSLVDMPGAAIASPAIANHMVAAALDATARIADIALAPQSEIAHLPARPRSSAPDTQPHALLQAVGGVDTVLRLHGGLVGIDGGRTSMGPAFRASSGELAAPAAESPELLQTPNASADASRIAPARRHDRASAGHAPEPLADTLAAAEQQAQALKTRMREAKSIGAAPSELNSLWAHWLSTFERAHTLIDELGPPSGPVLPAAPEVAHVLARVNTSAAQLTQEYVRCCLDEAAHNPHGWGEPHSHDLWAAQRLHDLALQLLLPELRIAWAQLRLGTAQQSLADKFRLGLEQLTASRLRAAQFALVASRRPFESTQLAAVSLLKEAHCRQAEPHPSATARNDIERAKRVVAAMVGRHAAAQHAMAVGNIAAHASHEFVGHILGDTWRARHAAPHPERAALKDNVHQHLEHLQMQRQQVRAGTPLQHALDEEIRQVSMIASELRPDTA